MISKIFAFFLIILLFFCQKTFGQEKSDSAKSYDLQPISITATRLQTVDTKAPLAITVLDKYRIQTGQQQLSLFESLGAVPGLFAMDPDNFAQDLRISIRGFGARASFGIRGVRVIVDGIPESTPDGQADIDNLDVGVVRQMEVIRGPSSGLYGNASGGVINLLTENPTNLKPSVEAQVAGGSYGFQQYQLKIGQKAGKIQYFVSASHVETIGFRQHAEMKNTMLNSKMKVNLGKNAGLTMLINYANSPIAQDPGALTSTQIAADRQQAQPDNVKFNAGETVEQGKIGLVFEKKFNEKHEISLRSFYTKRNFWSNLPTLSSGIVHFNRDFIGGGISYQFTTKIYRLKLGIDLENQADNRQRYDNNNGVKSDLAVFDQKEEFQNRAVFLNQDLKITDKFTAVAGLRYDYIRIRVTDYYLANGDQSGQLNFEKLSPMIGLTYAFSTAANLYSNYSTSYESPTLNEFSNNPSGIGGINENLKPQRAKNIEFGLKGIYKNVVKYEIAAFHITTEDELVPYTITGMNGKTFYRNVGQTDRKGIEFGLNVHIYKGFTGIFNETYNVFEYSDYLKGSVNLAGNRLPGIPNNLAYAELRYFHKKGFYAIAQLRSASKLFANDENTVESIGYKVLNFRAGYSLKLKHFLLEPYFGINNLTGEKYNANVQINVATLRFFEPSSGAYFYGGLKIEIGK